MSYSSCLGFGSGIYRDRHHQKQINLRFNVHEVHFFAMQLGFFVPSIFLIAHFFRIQTTYFQPTIILHYVNFVRQKVILMGVGVA